MSQYNGIQYGANIKNEEPKQEQNQSSFAFPMDVQRLAYICGSCGAKVRSFYSTSLLLLTISLISHDNPSKSILKMQLNSRVSRSG